MFEFSAWGGAWLLLADIALMLILAGTMLAAARLAITRARPVASDAASQPGTQL